MFNLPYQYPYLSLALMLALAVGAGLMLRNAIPRTSLRASTTTPEEPVASALSEESDEPMELDLSVAASPTPADQAAPPANLIKALRIVRLNEPRQSYGGWIFEEAPHASDGGFGRPGGITVTYYQREGVLRVMGQDESGAPEFFQVVDFTDRLAKSNRRRAEMMNGASANIHIITGDTAQTLTLVAWEVMLILRHTIDNRLANRQKQPVAI